VWSGERERERERLRDLLLNFDIFDNLKNAVNVEWNNLIKVVGLADFSGVKLINQYI
jgi:hypothetical protein